TVSGNYAYIVSAVDLGDVSAISASAETGRPLQGQSEYTANLLLDYESKKIGMNASLAYNVYGKRIAFIAPDGLPNVWEMPFHQVDFVFRKKVSKSLSVNGKIRNLLDPQVQFRQGDRLFQGLRRGQNYTLGLSMEI
ncbi:MAG: TonB-dependent receptor, partial [Bdellovibrionales bacterium]|nr:TonB-dependent receptor [Bdellovibrionales bacterium]NQZ19676.1 TonB-dependent receptor [Bdellovibrionales bacterium]